MLLPFVRGVSRAAAAASCGRDAPRRVSVHARRPLRRSYAATAQRCDAPKKKEANTASTTAASTAAAAAPLGVPYSRLTVGIPREIYPREKRVAATPESVERLIRANFKRVLIERDAGAASHFSDAAYERAGATITDNVWKEADIVLKVCVCERLAYL